MKLRNQIALGNLFYSLNEPCYLIKIKLKNKNISKINGCEKVRNLETIQYTQIIFVKGAWFWFEVKRNRSVIMKIALVIKF